MSKNNDKVEAGRRQALKAITVAGGGIVATKWSKPVVQSVVMPAHAQTSLVLMAGGGGSGGTATSG